LRISLDAFADKPIGLLLIIEIIIFFSNFMVSFYTKDFYVLSNEDDVPQYVALGRLSVPSGGGYEGRMYCSNDG